MCEPYRDQPEDGKKSFWEISSPSPTPVSKPRPPRRKEETKKSYTPQQFMEWDNEE